MAKFKQTLLDVLKTKGMIFRKSNQPFPYPNFIICNTTIEYVECFKFSGIIIDRKLNWRNHIDNTGRKISKAIWIKI